MGARRVEVLGTVRARIDGEVREITSPTQRLVLALLAAARPHPVSRGRLIAAVWPAGPPAAADNSLNSHLSRLRGVLGAEAIVRDGGSYRLQLSVDADLPGDDDSIAGVRALLDRWRGEPFGELGDHPFLVERAGQLAGRQRALRRRLVDLLIDADDRVAAVAELQSLVHDQPLDEANWTELVRVLTDLDRRADALRAAQAARSALDEVGLHPSRSLEAAEQAALDARPTDRGGLADSLVGRARDLEALRRAVDRHRLVTVVGPGGVGKTTLVLSHLERSPRADDEMVVCDLATATSADEVELTVAQALGATPVPPIRDQIATELRRRPRTIVLDACEGRVDEVRPLVAALRSIDGVSIIATSRSPIAAPGERLLELGPLEVGESAELLRRRAAELGEVLEPGGLVDEICRRVDHLPLGIELASALLRVLDPAQLIERLDASIDVLQAPERPNRHRSLRATVEQSLELLAPDERRALLWLSTFVAPFSPDRAEDLLERSGTRRGDVPATVVALRNASLLHSVRTPTGRRLTMLDTVRAVVGDHLRRSDECGAAIRAHVAVAARVARRIDTGIVTGDERRWATTADEHLADLRAAHRRAVDLGDVDAASTIVTGLFQYAYDRIRPEVGRWAEDTLGRLAGELDEVAELSASAALGAFQIGRLERAAELATVATTSRPGTRGAARGGIVLANVHLVAGRLDEAIEAATDATTDAEHGAYLRGLAHLLLAVASHYAGREERAHASARVLEGLAARDGAAPSLTAYARYCAAELSATTDPTTARRHLDACLATARSVGNSICEGVALVTAGTLASDEDPEEARRGFLRTIEHWRHRPDRYRQWITLRNFAVTLARCHDLDTAAFVLGAAEAHAPPAYGAEADRLRLLRETLVRELGDQAGELLRRGARSDLDEVVSVCLDGRSPD